MKYDTFDVFELKAMYTIVNRPELIDGVIKPLKNIAKDEYGARVEGGGESNMLNENPDEFTCHENERYILLQFNQPYYIDSLRMLLGNNMNYSNKYSFFIETSLDKDIWEMAVDKRDEILSGWLEFDFEPRSAIFIKITGTRSDIVRLYSKCYFRNIMIMFFYIIFQFSSLEFHLYLFRVSTQFSETNTETTSPERI